MNEDIRIIGFRRSNQGRFSNVYMIKECKECHAILEFPSNIVKIHSESDIYIEYINCPNCRSEVVVINANLKEEE